MTTNKQENGSFTIYGIVYQLITPPLFFSVTDCTVDLKTKPNYAQGHF